MFKGISYVPVLRWKMGEWMALRGLGDQVRARLLPLIEIPPSRLPPRDRLYAGGIATCGATTAQQLERSWGRLPFLINMNLLDQIDTENGVAARLLRSVLEECASRGLGIIPVTGLAREGAYQRAVSDWAARHGNVGLRVAPTELQSRGGQDSILRFPDQVGLRRENVVLVVDFGHLGDGVLAFEKVWGRVPEADSWALVAFLGGSFPVDLTGYEVGIQSAPRREWTAWRSQMAGDRGGGSPLFGDFTPYSIRCSESPSEGKSQCLNPIRGRGIVADHEGRGTIYKRAGQCAICGARNHFD